MDTILKEQLQKASTRLRNYIVSDSWMIELENTLRESFDDSVIDVVQREFLFVMLGLESPSDVPANVAIETELTQKEAQEIIEELYPRIIGPYEQEILKLTNEQTTLTTTPEQNRVEDFPEDHLPSYESRIPTPEQVSARQEAPKNIPTNKDGETLDMWEKYEKTHSQEDLDLSPGEVHPKRNEILREIENPTKTTSATNAREKARRALAGENYIPESKTQPKEPAQTQTPNYGSERQEEILSSRNDPYRESTE